MKTTQHFKAAIVLLLFLLALHSVGYSQPTYVVQFVIKNVQDEQSINTLDALMQSQPGMIVTRTDFWTRNFIGIVEDPTNFDELSLRSLLFSIGLGIDCFQQSPYVGQPLTPISARICERNDY